MSKSMLALLKRPKRLIASIHDVSPRFTEEVDRLQEHLAPRLAGVPPALLVVPDHWGSAPIAGDAPFRAKLRGWADAGADIFLHGWFHRDDSRHAGALAGLKAKHMTAGEGEFLGLDRAEALRRMIEGRALIEDAIGQPVAGFIAPAWLYGIGAREALGEAGFALAEDHMRVWRPADGAVLARGPVVTWASRTPARMASSLLFARLARTALRPLLTVRIAIHPGDAYEPSILHSIDITMHALAQGRTIARYRDLS